jgi:hypothetical protein
VIGVSEVPWQRKDVIEHKQEALFAHCRMLRRRIAAELIQNEFMPRSNITDGNFTKAFTIAKF